MYYRDELLIAGRLLTIETGKLAGQAGGAVTIQYGDTVLLAAATASKQPRPDIDFLPLTVDFEERLYAAGKIPGGFYRREGRPSESAILISRLTDRPLRPLFPKGFRNDVQIVVDALSADQENEPDILSIIGASSALTISDIPFDGPVGAVRVGYIGGELVLNPTSSELLSSQLELTIAGTADAVVMVEAGAKEVSEELLLDAIAFGHDAIQDLVKMQLRMRDAVGKTKRPFVPAAPDTEAKQAVLEVIGESRLTDAIYQGEKGERSEKLVEIEAEAVAALAERFDAKRVLAAVGSLVKEIVRRNILEKGLRPDGRNTTTVRPITCEVGLLPRVHGSGLFTRGQTQVLNIATLGSIGDEQKIEGLGLEASKRFMHHYNFPPFSTGEVRRVGSPGRREIGHGALAERAISAVIPSTDEFPYTIRLVSEVLSSNGSTSMGSVCGSTLSLMDAGVPIKAPVSGVAMGLITGGDGQYAILTDILGMEDQLGDMDFKVAGTAEGVTALQMDVKVKGVSRAVMARALEQAREGRLFILDKLLEALPEPRQTLSAFAPRILRTHIPVEKIGALIGPGGKNIRAIQESAGVKIDVEEDGGVFISGPSPEATEKALAMVEGLTKEVQIGATYTGKVTRVTNFGAFVEILPGKDGLVRIGELDVQHIARVEDVANIGDEMTVKVIEIDSQGRINLSRRALLEGGDDARRPISHQPTDRWGGPRPEGPRGGGFSRDRRPPSPMGRPEHGPERRPPFGRRPSP